MNIVTVQRKIKRPLQTPPAARRSIRDITRAYFARESVWHFAIEALVFGVIAAISAWPILNAAMAINELLQRS
jgi:hypothetical protein